MGSSLRKENSTRWGEWLLWLLALLSKRQYQIRITFTDGQTVWANYFHSDAGVRRHLDLTVNRQPGSYRVEFRLVVNGVQTLYNGSVDLRTTSKQKPLTLDWI